MNQPARVRALGWEHFTAQGRELVALCDPLGIARFDGQGELIVPRIVWEIARDCDGVRTSEAIAELVSDRTQYVVSRADVEAVGQALSERLACDEEHFRAAAQRELASFLAAEECGSDSVDRELAQDAFALRQRIAGLVADDWDMPEPPDPCGAWTTEAPISSAGPLYARTWAALRQFNGRFARVVLLAPAHAALEEGLVVADKPWRTPLGVVPTDPEAVRLLGATRGQAALALRSAAVFGRQALFLCILWRDVPMVPVLVASSAGLDECVPRLTRLQGLPGRTLWLAACDLARVRSVTEPVLDRIAGPLRAVAFHQRDVEAPAKLSTSLEATRRRGDDREFVDALTRLDRARLSSDVDELGEPTPRSLLATLFASCLLASESPSTDPEVNALLGYQHFAAGQHASSAAAALFARGQGG